MSHWLKKLSPFATMIALSGCATVSTVPVVSDYCRIAVPISYDASLDTPETVAEIEAHNSKWVCVCEHDCPQKTVVK